MKSGCRNTRWALGTTFTARTATAPVMAAFSSPETLGSAEIDTFLAALALPGVPTSWERERHERFQGFEAYRPEAVRACTLIVHGEGDEVVSVDVARALAAAIRDATLVVVPGAGHALVLTQPDLVARRITEHEARCS